jgi:hypothetical protein
MWDRVSLLCVMTLHSIIIKRRCRRLRRGYRLRLMVGSFGGVQEMGVWLASCILFYSKSSSGLLAILLKNCASVLCFLTD